MNTNFAKTHPAALAVLAVGIVAGFGCDARVHPVQVHNETLRSQTDTVGSAVLCGGETNTETVSAYFDRVDAYINDPSDRGVLKSLYAANFDLHQHGHSRYLRPIELVEHGGPLSIEDWRKISELGAASLKDAGWRGCFFEDGKAAFEADGAGGFGLSSFDKDRSWHR